ncbi:bucentaur or craniofacial development-domain-containing protein [Lentinula raphanica]|nr:bucentaur or craniofacial development-domain-containing protein [Lentinula raphanica]
MLGSDSEDEEYIPHEKAHSFSSSESDDAEEPDSKRPRTQPSEPVESTEDQQRKRKELWKAFKDSVHGSSASELKEAQSKTVRVEKRYLFAGKEITDIIEVPADSAEAKKWPSASSEPTTSRTDSNSPPVHLPNSNASRITTIAAEVESMTPSTSSTPSQTTQKSVAPKRGPRKSKITLGEIPGSKSGSRSRPTKLTTLEKSAMDWRAHVSGQKGDALQDELEANRKQGGGGYLEKVEFLERVSERRESLLDASKNGKRRRG